MLELTKELKGKRRFGRYIPFKKEIRSVAEFKKFTGFKPSKEIEKAFEIANSGGKVHLKKQLELKNLGFELCFRNFNSHSGDTFIYQDEQGIWFFSVGMSNISQAGRGYETRIA